MYTVNLRAVCLRHGTTITDLARRTSIPQPSLSRYNTGRSDITLRQLGRIALALGVGVEDLVDSNVLTKDLHREIGSVERTALKRDKAWVSGVLADLQQHYRKVR